MFGPALAGESAPILRDSSDETYYGYCESCSVVSWAITHPCLHSPPFLILRTEILLSRFPDPEGQRPCSFQAYPQGSWESGWGQGKAYSGSRYQEIMGHLPQLQLSPKAASGLLI